VQATVIQVIGCRLKTFRVQATIFDSFHNRPAGFASQRGGIDQARLQTISQAVQHSKHYADQMHATDGKKGVFSGGAACRSKFAPIRFMSQICL
jgi:hypothetical protein